MSNGRFYFAESLWPDFGDSNTTETSERVARLLMEDSGAAFAQVVREDTGRPLTPPWLDTTAMAGDPGCGPVVIAASVAHAALGLPHAFDLAARHMLAADLPLRFPSVVPLNQNAKWLFVRGQREDFTPVHVGGMVAALDLGPGARSVAVLEYWGGQAANTVSTIDLHERRLRFRAPVPHAWTLAYSPDGAWILAGGAIVDAASGEAFELPIPATRSVAWWPTPSRSSLLLLVEEPGVPPQLVTFDLATATTETLGPVQVPYPGFESVNELAVAPDGSCALCGTGSPAPPGFAFGAGLRASLLDIASRKIEPVAPGFFEADGFVIEREHRQLTWIDRPTPNPVHVHDSLRQNRIELTLPGHDRHERVAGELWQFADYALRALDSGVGKNLSAEILWAWDAIRDLDPASDAIPALEGRMRELQAEVSSRSR